MEAVSVKPKRLRFTYNDDLGFLKEVVSQNPFRDPSAWDIIQKHLEISVQKSFTIKTLKNHLELLLEAFIKKDKVDQVRSGVEGSNCEIDELLREISLLSQEYNPIPKKKKPDKEKHLSELGKIIREQYASMFFEGKCEEDKQQFPQEAFDEEHDYCTSDAIPVSCEVTAVGNEHEREHEEQIQKRTTPEPTLQKHTEEDNVEKTSTPKNKRGIHTPVRKRQNQAAGLRKSSLNYLAEKQEKEREIKIKELQLEERKIALEEKRIALSERQMNLEEARFEIEKSERIHKMQIELEEKKITSQLLKCQQEFIENLVKHNQNI